MLDIYALNIFLTAADAGSFSEAGRRLLMSQPAVSMQIRSLEKQLDVDLFQRAGRNISLTEAGLVLIPLARDLVNRSISVKETMTSLKGEVVGNLKLACSTTAGKYVLPKLIAGFVDNYPAVRVVCNVGTRGSALQMLREGQAHLAVTSLRESSKDLDFRQFIDDPIVLIVPPTHAWCRRTSITIDELTKGRFIRREVNSGTQQTLIERLAEFDLNPNEFDTVMVLGNSEAIYMAVSEGIGVAFVSRRAAADGIARGRVIEVSIEDLQIVQQLYMARHTHNAATSAQSAFWDFVYRPDIRSLLDFSDPNDHAGASKEKLHEAALV